MDVTAERIAQVYAQAFWNVALKQPDPVTTFAELQAVVTDVLDKFPEFDKVFSSGLIDHDEKVQMIDRVFGKQLSAPVLNFLKVLSVHERLDLLRLIVRETHEFQREHLGQVEVDVLVADKLDEANLAELTQLLRERGAKRHVEPVIRIKVDPELIGGIIVKIGDRVYDGSLRTRSEMARRSIIAKAHEMIETNPEHFIHTAG
jgi:F-type H+-transporting ATPase subunit delta